MFAEDRLPTVKRYAIAHHLHTVPIHYRRATAIGYHYLLRRHRYPTSHPMHLHLLNLGALHERNGDADGSERHAYGMHGHAGTIAALHSYPRHMDLHKLGSVVYVLQFDADARSYLHLHGRHLR